MPDVADLRTDRLGMRRLSGPLPPELKYRFLIPLCVCFRGGAPASAGRILYNRAMAGDG